MTAIAIVFALLIPPALAYLGVLPWPLALIGVFAVLFIAAWGIDRRRRVGARSPVRDENRADIGAATVAGSDVIQTPLAAERPADRPRTE